MKRWISILMMAAFVTTTTIPSHAMIPSSSTNTPQTQQVSKKHDCHHGAKTASDKTTQDKDSSTGKSCCDKERCKCVTGSCNSGFTSIFNNSGASLITLSSSQSRFDFADGFIELTLSERLKRPPRA